jgi:outer membrane immunogenic protein
MLRLNALMLHSRNMGTKTLLGGQYGANSMSRAYRKTNITSCKFANWRAGQEKHMRRHLGGALASIALLGFCGIGGAAAADLAARPYTKAPPAAVAAYNWSGCYVGVEGGGDWGRTRSISNGTNNGVVTGSLGMEKTTTNISGGVIGGTIGCNYQVNQWVVGIEGDDSWVGHTGSSQLIPNFNTAFREDVSGSWLATIRGRAGFVVNNTLLFYGTAGAAFADLKIHEFNPTGAGNALVGATETNTYSGWTAGVGAEWGFAPNWSAKVEYLYVDLGRHDFFVTTATGCCTSQSTRFTDNLLRVGVSYRFNWAGPVVAKY